jgi:hypothetical protein
MKKQVIKTETAYCHECDTKFWAEVSTTVQFFQAPAGLSTQQRPKTNQEGGDKPDATPPTKERANS